MKCQANINKKIYYAKPSVTALEIDYVTDAVKHGWGEKCYDYIYRFQQDFEQYLGVNHALATSSCTSALQLSFAGLNIGPDDEVICPDITWIASIAPLLHLGAKPILVDILPGS